MGRPQVQTGSRLVPSSYQLLTSVLRSGCADPFRAQVLRTRSICRAESESETAEPDETLPPDPLRIFRIRGRHESGRASLLSPGPNPPSTRAVLAANIYCTMVHGMLGGLAPRTFGGGGRVCPAAPATLRTPSRQ